MYLKTVMLKIAWKRILHRAFKKNNNTGFNLNPDTLAIYGTLKGNPRMFLSDREVSLRTDIKTQK